MSSCSQNGIQSTRTRNKCQYSARLQPSAPRGNGPGDVEREGGWRYFATDNSKFRVFINDEAEVPRYSHRIWRLAVSHLKKEEYWN